ncbi:MAG: hypothetical protein WB697_00970 [Stellaceae bacterium]
MKMQIALAGAMLVATALPALADSSYFIVSGPDHHCRIVDQRPTEKSMTVVNPDGSTYTTRTEAEGAMKTIKVCE